MHRAWARAIPLIRVVSVRRIAAPRKTSSFSPAFILSLSVPPVAVDTFKHNSIGILRTGSEGLSYLAPKVQINGRRGAKEFTPVGERGKFSERQLAHPGEKKGKERKKVTRGAIGKDNIERRRGSQLAVGKKKINVRSVRRIVRS